MSTYLLINILIILFPLVLSFDKNLKFYRNVKYVLASILIVSSAYIVWDIIATNRGDWAFSEQHLLGIYFYVLPLEEILFFITVPYSCIFIYETIKFYINEKVYSIKKNIFLIPVISFIVLALVFNKQAYTFTVLLYSAAFFLLGVLTNSKLLTSKIFWISILICFVPFFIVNYFLTSIPVVTYNDTAFSAIRLITIPLEDFLYSFSMVSLWILFYEFFRAKKK
jgi:lycopene cyclase domain-containing protein